MSDMTPQGKMMQILYDKLDDALYKRGSIRYRLDTQDLWRIEKWQLRRRLKHLDAKIDYYQRCIRASKKSAAEKSARSV